MLDDLYAFFTIIIISLILYTTYKYRRTKFKLKHILIAFLYSILTIFLMSFSITLCYEAPNLLILEVLFLVFVSTLMIERKDIKNSVLMQLFIFYVIQSAFFYSFVNGKDFTSSLTYIRDINYVYKQKHNPIRLKALPLWHTYLTGIYKVQRST